MMVLWEKRKVNEKDLVEALYLKANTLTDLLKKLEAKGYVTISKDKEDKRNIIISLTDKGLALRDKAVDIPSCIYQDHWLTDEEFLVFKGLLEKMLKGNW
jgi:DNA-binding MarR family transcriptional regulator